MSKHLTTLAQFLPARLVQRANDSHHPIDQPQAERFSAAVLHIEVMGFAQLNDRMRSDHDVKRLSDVLNHYYSQLVEIIFEQGGDVQRFGTSTIIAMWLPENEADSDVPTATLRAARTALLIQRELKPREIVPGIEVGMRIGVGAGQVQVLHVGGTENRWEPILMGSPLQQAEEAMKQAEIGMTLLPKQPWVLIRYRAAGQRFGDSYAVLEGIKGTLPTLNIPYAQPNPRSAAPMWSYCPGPVRHYLSSKADTFPHFRRLVAIVCVRIPQLGPECSLEDAQLGINTLLECVNDSKGTLIELSFEHNAATFTAGIGVHQEPSSTTAGCAALLAFTMYRALQKADLNSQIGVSTGHAWCGAIGNERRKTFGVVGDIVEIAHTLMLEAESILCDTPTFLGAKDSVEFATLPPIKLVGKSAPVHRPTELITTVATGTDVIGRLPEKQLLFEAVNRLANHSLDAVILLEGPPGIGKSRLLRHIVDTSVARDVYPLQGATDPIDRTTPLHAWREVLKRILGIENLIAEDIDPEEILKKIGDDERDQRYASLLNNILPLGLTESDTTLELSGAIRSLETRALFLRLFQRFVKDSPAVLVLDDIHWMDGDSWTLLNAVIETVSPLLLVLASEPMTADAPPEFIALTQSEHCIRVPLGPLPVSELIHLAEAKLNVSELPPSLRQLLQTASKGHPLYCEQLLKDLEESGLLSVNNGKCEISDALAQYSAPESVEALIKRRIDRLPPAPLLTLQTASVVGRVFTFEALHDIYPGEVDMAKIADSLQFIANCELAPIHTLEPEEAHIFKHSLVHQIAHESLPPKTRRQIHQAMAEWYEEYRDESTLTGEYPRLANHWHEAGQPEKASTYFSKSANLALRAGCWTEAIATLETALSLADQSYPVHFRARWSRQIGEAYYQLQQAESAQKAVITTLNVLSRSVPTSSFGKYWLIVRERLIQVFHRVWTRHSGDEADRRLLTEATRADVLLGELSFKLNDPLLASAATYRAVNVAERLGPTPELARAYTQMAIFSGFNAQHNRATDFADRALSVAQGQDDATKMSRVLLPLSIYFAGVAEWEASAESLERAAGFAKRIGDQAGWIETRAVAGVLAFHQGHYKEALSVFNQVEEAGGRSNNHQQLFWGRCGHLETLIRLDQINEATRLLRELKNMETHLTPANTIRLQSAKALFSLRSREFSEAIDHLRHAIDLIKAHPPTSYLNLETYGFLAEVIIDRISAAPSDELTTLAHQLLGDFERFATTFPHAEARCKILRAVVLWREKKETLALSLFEAAVESAEDCAMPYDGALAQLERGRALGFSDREGRHSLNTAAEQFKALLLSRERHVAYSLTQLD